MDARPFYFSYELDTIYVRRHCLLALSASVGMAAYHDTAHDPKPSLLSENLRSLQMDWEMEPYWWRGSQQEGPALLRSFPYLERFTLVVTISKWAWDDGEKEILMEIVKNHTAAQMQMEQNRYPEWQMPVIYFHGRKERRDWSICSIAKSLLAEHHSDTRLLYDWAIEID
jgi:hypothetical protein